MVNVLIIIGIFILLHFIQQGLYSMEVEGFNAGHNNYEREFAPALRSFGRTSHIAELNETVWDPNCNPHGAFYTQRYSHPKYCSAVSNRIQYPLRVGYYNTCGNMIN